MVEQVHCLQRWDFLGNGPSSICHCDPHRPKDHRTSGEIHVNCQDLDHGLDYGLSYGSYFDLDVHRIDYSGHLCPDGEHRLGRERLCRREHPTARELGSGSFGKWVFSLLPMSDTD
jgi:hypothetical protein